MPGNKFWDEVAARHNTSVQEAQKDADYAPDALSGSDDPIDKNNLRAYEAIAKGGKGKSYKGKDLHKVVNGNSRRSNVENPAKKNESAVTTRG